MGKYILDTNVIINFWNRGKGLFDYFLECNEIIIIRGVLEELARKEKRRFNGENVMSERFMKLVPLMIEIDVRKFKEFLKDIDFDNIKGEVYYYNGKKLTKNDILLIFTSKEKEDFSLVTEDKALIEAAKELLGES
ncbi:hypothetical protein FHH43_16500, partial [Clostridium perfringens]|nr:hypothetical protein [Clostridium perfringens]